ncbi:MAG TPA: cellulase N-terminal Ig-like domain-containing protein, partial [Bacillota bacterium]|nr:cellulase N-terminal Ig-like domain-containing protein [Bacillota bacterium]
MDGTRFVFTGLFLSLLLNAQAASLRLSDDQPLQLPPVGSYQLRILAPTLLELTLITTKKPDSAQLEAWDFVDAQGQCRLPESKDLVVMAGDKSVPVKALGFKRRVLYAPFKQRDLRIGNYLYLQLATPVPDNQMVEVKDPSRKLWPPALQFSAKAEPLRWSPALHLNQTGYLPAYPKKAMVGYYLGSLGEMDLPQALAAPPVTNAPTLTFQILEAQSSKQVFQGPLTLRPDRGFPFESYQHVLEADFSSLKTPGQYRLLVPGLGTSFAFFIDDAVAGAFARTYALGLYHQRCGTENALPFTRFT